MLHLINKRNQMQNKRSIFNEIKDGFSALSAERTCTQIIKTSQVTVSTIQSLTSPEAKTRIKLRNKQIKTLKEVSSNLKKLQKLI
jgi:hypothetical protein